MEIRDAAAAAVRALVLPSPHRWVEVLGAPVASGTARHGQLGGQRCGEFRGVFTCLEEGTLGVFGFFDR